MSLKYWYIGSAVLALVAMQPAGMAQQTTASEGGLEEVTVTAQRREQSLQDVPIAVTAVSVEALQNRALQGLGPAPPAFIGRMEDSGRLHSPLHSPQELQEWPVP